MLEASSSVVLENSAAAVSGSGGGGGGGTDSSAGFAAAVVVGGSVVSGGGFGSGGEEGDRNFGVNRWPREETLALLKIRSDMDVAFRDSTPKAPLWDEVSRKLAELGYHRNAKKCKEKFENIYKYHKRTKEGRSRQQNGKHYRYFEQLEVFDSQSSLPSPPFSKFETSTMETTIEMTKSLSVLKPTNTSVTQPDVTPSCSIQNPNMEVMSTSTSTTSSSEKESEGDLKKKRKLGDYFERLMKQVLERQDNLQNKFIDAIEKCERDRIAREEAWKLQEMARLKREEEMLAQERAIAAAKDAAVIAFLQKISEQATSVQLQLPEIPTPKEKFMGKQENNCAMEYSIQPNPSRWPKAEVEALIKLRTNLQTQYQDNGPKGPLWEEVSAAMKKLGYDRNAKRCKEKWENINKYYKRVKDSNKRRPEDSKTCTYFHLLDSLHQKKSKKVIDLENSVGNLKPEDILMQMMSQQQQQQHSHQPQELVTEDAGSENVDQNQEDDGEDDDDDNEGDYQIVANNPSSGTTME